MKDEERRLTTLQLLIQLLPADNCRLLRHLLALLTAVCRHPDTQMDAHSLAILFTVTIIVPRKVGSQRWDCFLLTGVTRILLMPKN